MAVLLIYEFQNEEEFILLSKELKDEKELLEFVNNYSKTHGKGFRVVDVYKVQYKIGLKPINVIVEYELGCQIVC